MYKHIYVYTYIYKHEEKLKDLELIKKKLMIIQVIGLDVIFFFLYLCIFLYIL